MVYEVVNPTLYHLITKSFHQNFEVLGLSCWQRFFTINLLQLYTAHLTIFYDKLYLTLKLSIAPMNMNWFMLI